MRTITHPVIGLGGTHVRFANVQRTVIDNRFFGMPTVVGEPTKLICPKRNGVVDLSATLDLVSEGIKASLPEGAAKFVGIDAPGAWQENGLPYPGTTPNIPDLASFHFASEFASMMGPEWKAEVNNDGVSGVLAIAQMLLTHIDQFPAVKEALSKQRAGLAGFVPGTGFGAGAYRINNGLAKPVKGPQQFFDIKLWVGADFLNCGWITPETACAGIGFHFQAMNSLLAERYPENKLTGDFIRKLAFLNDPTIAKDEKTVARSIYRTAARGIAETMKLTYDGGDTQMTRKAVVNDPWSVEAKFWKGVKNTRVFILGGWLTDPSVKGFISQELAAQLKGFRRELLPVFADEIPGVAQMLSSDTTELIGASLLMPEEYAKG